MYDLQMSVIAYSMLSNNINAMGGVKHIGPDGRGGLSVEFSVDFP